MNYQNRLPILMIMLALVATALACAFTTTAAQPAVTVIAPPNGAQVAAGQTIEVQFHAEDEEAVVQVQMTVNGNVVATQQSPLEAGQTPLDGILRWTTGDVGTFNLVLTAYNADGQKSAPAAVSIQVIEPVPGVPTPTLMPTPVPQAKPTATLRPGQPTATQQPTAQPTATTKPGQPTATQQPTAQPTATTKPGQPTATQQPPAQPTATQQPPAIPTTPPTPTRTPIPSPEITSFYADLYTIDPNQCATIYWMTAHATEVRLNQEVVSASGNRLYCYGDLGSGPTEFDLRATNGNETAMQLLTIVGVEAQEVQLTAAFVPAESGSVAENGTMSNSIFPGDDRFDNKHWIGFISFDTSNLPPDATIVSADLDLGPCSVNGDPFSDLVGPLYVTYLYYGDLDAGDYAATEGKYVADVYGCPAGVLDVASSLQAYMGPPRYQITLSWPVRSDFDGEIDDVTYTAPVLYITYIP